MTIYVDAAALEQVSGSLTRSASELEGMGETIPAAPDAGIGIGPIMAILARLLANVGELADGLRDAGTAVEQANSSYRDQDSETADQLTLQQWGQ
ncbi:hypothetical protein QMK17_17385 [Rhodococcus sp. G-MC3]|uniref:hypothetical protein n=1 Tax=Rhodococcus sp. G-MC3 TaxID=3046209 RepID=UPI0024BB2937|nr:hypothetical protein [Rhodococcus sp. G-MC3]MDJ0395100.1 hypothetical protein [Rhodococcus sp. G-MC3]